MCVRAADPLAFVLIVLAAGKYGYLINVCQSISNTPQAKGCPTNAGICQVGYTLCFAPPTLL